MPIVSRSNPFATVAFVCLFFKIILKSTHSNSKKYLTWKHQRQIGFIWNPWIWIRDSAAVGCSECWLPFIWSFISSSWFRRNSKLIASSSESGSLLLSNSAFVSIPCTVAWTSSFSWSFSFPFAKLVALNVSYYFCWCHYYVFYFSTSSIMLSYSFLNAFIGNYLSWFPLFNWSIRICHSWVDTGVCNNNWDCIMLVADNTGILVWLARMVFGV